MKDIITSENDCPIKIIQTEELSFANNIVTAQDSKLPTTFLLMSHHTSHLQILKLALHLTIYVQTEQ